MGNTRICKGYKYCRDKEFCYHSHGNTCYSGSEPKCECVDYLKVERRNKLKEIGDSV